MLSPYRVLDLTDERGMLCGQILADLGADVVAVEPPGGSKARNRGPFAEGVDRSEASLWWAAYSRNKRSIELDPESSAGRERLKELATEADFLIESAEPGYLAAIGLGYEHLSALNPGLIYVSISPFGQDGPKANFAATDLTVLAAAGPLALTGDDDRPPLRVGVPQGFLHGSGEAAIGALVAHEERKRSGSGQHVDVSAQQAAAQATMSMSLATQLGDNVTTRSSGGLKFGPLDMQLRWPAKDGHVAITFLFGSAIGPFTARLMNWIYEEGFCDEATRDKDWLGYTDLLVSGEEPVEEFERVKRVVGDFVATKTKQELLEATLERGVLMAPVTTLEEVITSDQLADRDYFQDVDRGVLGRKVRYPGPFAKFGESEMTYRHAAPARPAPGAGVAWTAPGRALTSAVNNHRHSLEGLKILDLMWVMAGPAATRSLADYGATVVRIESTTRIDTARTIQPFQGGPGPENSGLFQNMNVGKLGLTLDLTSEDGKAVFLDLVRWADVVCESFSPKAMKKWGLGYETLKEANPDIIMLSTCLMGQSGPLATFAGFGNLAAAISGFFPLASWPDRPPAGPFGAYTDYVSPRFTAAAILAAVEYRDRTGKGQYIDQSQGESALHFLTPAILDYTVNGVVQSGDGNRDPQMSPHGVFPVRGDDAWIAIAARNDDDWEMLAGLIGDESLFSDPRFSTLEARKANEDALEAVIAAWTAGQDGLALQQTLQDHNVPAHVVQNSPEMMADPQLAHRGHFVELPHDIHGKTTVEGSRFRLSRTPALVDRAAPTFGRDNFEVLEQILGYDFERIGNLAAAEVLQ
jgi:crotonobetainyl-CoA:carnitine CoA-transferase CaiB-like acyl-CoA transferase